MMGIKLRFLGWLLSSQLFSKVPLGSVIFKGLLGRFIHRGDLVVDCGANEGHITHRLLKTGAHVIAFEPHPAAFAVLQARYKDHPKVELYNQAVGPEEKRIRLFCHVDGGMDTVEGSTGTSIYAQKENVSKDKTVEVLCVRLSDFFAPANFQGEALEDGY